MRVFTLPALYDNYNFVIYDEGTKTVAAVDPSGFNPIDSFLQERQWHLHWILNTHQHPDHVGGNLELKQKYSCQIVASEYDKHRIPGWDRGLKEGDHFLVGRLEAQILFVPGHTKGHIAYHFPQHKILFCGDTLFSLGCGRLFEGTPQELLQSLKKLKSLPSDTVVHCAHEYTLKNGEFALQWDPHNRALQNYYDKTIEQRKNNLFTVPFKLKDQIQCNPFLRTHTKEIAYALGLKHSSTNELNEFNELEVFTLLREKKDNF